MLGFSRCGLKPPGPTVLPEVSGQISDAGGARFPGPVISDLNVTSTVNAPPAQVNVVSNGGTASKLVSLIDEPEVLKFTQKDYQSGLKKYVIKGTSTAVGATVTVTLDNGKNAGQIIGTAVVDAAGKWKVVRTVAQGAPKLGGTTRIDVTSSGNDSLLNKALIILP